MDPFRIKRYLFFLFLICGAPCWPQAPPQSSDVKSSSIASNAFSHERQLLQLGKYDEAITELQQIASSKPGLNGISHELGMAFYKKGDYTHAADSFKQAVQQDSQDNEATQMLGLSYYLGGKLPIHRAHAFPSGVRARGPGACTESHRTRCQTSACAFSAGRNSSLPVAGPRSDYGLSARTRHRSGQCS